LNNAVHAQSGKATSDLQAKKTHASVQPGALECFLSTAFLRQVCANFAD